MNCLMQNGKMYQMKAINLSFLILTSSAKDFIKKALQVDPKSRLTAKDALTHPWITGPGANLLNAVRPNIKKYEH